MLEEKYVVMILPMVSGMVISCSMVDFDSACGAEHEDSLFLVGSYRVITFF